MKIFLTMKKIIFTIFGKMHLSKIVDSEGNIWVKKK